MHFGDLQEETSAVCESIGDENYLSANVVQMALEVVVIWSLFEVMARTVSVVIRVYEPHIINLV